MKIDHAFVVPAYGKSPYLRDCLASLEAQTKKSPIVVSSSTPFDGLQDLCDEFTAHLVVHRDGGGIGKDWNAALLSVEARLVTIAHQDDIYKSHYAEALHAAARAAGGSAFFFCDAEEVTYDGMLRSHDLNNRVKRAIVAAAFLWRRSIAGAVSKRLLLGFGNPVVCPTVTLNMELNPTFRFREDLRTNMDWLAWAELAGTGPLTRIDQTLVQHRVHDESETARCLDDGARMAEDMMVFERMWPTIMARLLSRFYRRSYTGYSE